VTAWHSFLARILARAYFNRITLLFPERLPASGPVLYLGLHRNGAVDGFVYASVLPRATFLISTQLRKSLLGRLIFSGIEVVRRKDEGDPKANEEALGRCREHLTSGGALVVFPEGTSTLGPRHLPFKSGAARILCDTLATGGPITVVPLAITYEAPASFRSNVEVAVGPGIPTDLPDSMTAEDRLCEMRRRMTIALEETGVNVDSEATQEKIQKLAYASTLATPRSYHQSLKTFEKAIPGPIERDWVELEPQLRGRTLLTHQGIPLFPMKHAWLYVLALFVTGPLVVAGGLVNFVPLLGAWLAGRTFADAPNVVSLWRILVGVPLVFLWMAGVLAASILLHQPLAFGAYLLLTLVAGWLYYRVKKLSVAVVNLILHPGLRSRMLAFRETVLEALAHAGA
jgi:1-acyl-sn-glycerol-3-phosphate acyltransferase